MKYFSMLIKPASSACNLRCSYCFYADVASSRERANYGIMNDDTMKHLIDAALSFIQEEVTITFAFQGGEPTCAGLDYFKKFVTYVNSQKKENHHFQYSIQTNATLLNEEWMSFLYENHFLVGVSLDGYIKNHNKCRKDAYNKDTYMTIMNNISLLRKYNIEFNILTVLTSELSKHPKELYEFYHKNRFDFVQLIPCLPKFNEEYDQYALKPKEFASFYKIFFDLWYADYQKQQAISITLFDNVIPLFAGIPPQQCGYLGYCHPQFVIEADGSVYPCDFYVLDEYKLGNINTDSIEALTKSSIVSRFIEMPRRKCKLCETCTYLQICHGQCKRMNINYFTDNYCGYQDFLSSKEKEILMIARNMH